MNQGPECPKCGLTQDWDRNALTEIMGLRTENRRLKVANDRALAEIERLRIRWWNHGDICSQLCSDACNEMHTFGHGCAFASDPVLSVTEGPEIRLARRNLNSDCLGCAYGNETDETAERMARGNLDSDLFESHDGPFEVES